MQKLDADYVIALVNMLNDNFDKRFLKIIKNHASTSFEDEIEAFMKDAFVFIRQKLAKKLNTPLIQPEYSVLFFWSYLNNKVKVMPLELLVSLQNKSERFEYNYYVQNLPSKLLEDEKIKDYVTNLIFSKMKDWYSTDLINQFMEEISSQTKTISKAEIDNKILEFVVSSAANIKVSLQNGLDQEGSELVLTVIFLHFENEIKDLINIELFKFLHQTIWKNIKKNNKVKKSLIILINQIDDFILINSLFSQILSKYSAEIIQAAGMNIRVTDIKKYNSILKNIYIEIKNGLNIKDFSEIKKKICKLSILMKIISVMNIKNDNAENIVDQLYEISPELESLLNDIVIVASDTLITHFAPQINSLIRIKEENFKAEIIETLITYVLEDLYDYYAINIHYLEIDESHIKELKIHIFNKFFDSFKNRLPVNIYKHFTSIAAEKFDVHENRIERKETTNGLDISDSILFKLKPKMDELISIFNDTYWQRLKLVAKAGINEIPQTLRKTENIFQYKIKKFYDASKSIESTIDNYLNYYHFPEDNAQFIKQSTIVLFFNELLNKIFLHVKELVIKSYKEVFMENMPENISNTIDKEVTNFIDYSKKLIEFYSTSKHLHLEFEGNNIKYNSKEMDKAIILANYGSELDKIKKNLVFSSMPIIPFLLNDEDGKNNLALTPSTYLIFTLILDSNLKGYAFKMTNDKITRITGIKERTIYKAFKDLVEKKLIIEIDKETYFIDAANLNKLKIQYDLT
jgi:hypothetical protein